MDLQQHFITCLIDLFLICNINQWIDLTTNNRAAEMAAEISAVEDLDPLF